MGEMRQKAKTSIGAISLSQIDALQFDGPPMSASGE